MSVHCIFRSSKGGVADRRFPGQAAEFLGILAAIAPHALFSMGAMSSRASAMRTALYMNEETDTIRIIPETYRSCGWCRWLVFREVEIHDSRPRSCLALVLLARSGRDVEVLQIRG